MKATHILAAALIAFVLTLSNTAFAVLVPAGVKLAAVQELTRQLPAEIESMDPAHIESWAANTVGLDLFEGLTRIDAAGAIVPGVAQSWVRTGPDTWRFKLREDARWSDGQPVTADDFVYAWRRVVDPKTGSKYTILVEFVKNGKAIVAGQAAPALLGVTAVDAHTLDVRTETPVAFFPEVAAMVTMAPVPRHLVERAQDGWTTPTRFVGNGAYVLADWQPNNRIVLLKNGRYWNARRVELSKVTYVPVEDDATALRMYEAGQFDYTYRIPSGLHAQVARRYGEELRAGMQIATYYYSLDNRDPAFKDKRVRQALSMVLDRELLTKRLLQSGEAPMYGLIAHGTKGASPFVPDWAAWPMGKRVDYARELLRQAGYSEARPLTFTLTYNTNDLHKKVALFAMSEWRTKLGVQIKLENVEFKVLLRARHEGRVQASRDGWFVDYNDAMSYFDVLRCGSIQNDQHYCNPKVDQGVAQANAQLDAAARTALLTRAHALAMEDYPMIPLFQYSADRLVKAYVEGYSPTNYVDQRASQDMYIVAH
jgi:oligopeptide transport system substrate-binding protein